MITFTGIIFSAVFVAAQIQTSSYSPRLAARLRRDPVVIAGLALPTATATYALFALAAIGGQSSRTGHEIVPVVTVIFGLVLLVVTLGAFVALVQRAFELTQIGGIFRGLMRRATAVIDDVHPLASASAGPAAAIEADPAAVVVVHDGPPAVVAAIDRGALLRLAGETGGFVEILPMVGQFVAADMPVLRIHGGSSAPAPARARRVLVMARQRTIDQDPAFVLRMLVDIAIRALSPAVNDPTTAVQALDRIEGLLVELHRHAPAPTSCSTATAWRAGSCRRPRGPTTWSSRSPRSGTTAPARCRSPDACTPSTTTCSPSSTSPPTHASSSSAGCSTPPSRGASPTPRTRPSPRAPTASASAAWASCKSRAGCFARRPRCSAAGSANCGWVGKRGSGPG